MDKTSVVEKIQKLYRLATSSNVHEAANAAAMAAELMEKHKIAMADLEIETGERIELEDISETTVLTGRRLAAWKTGLIGGVARAFDCKCIAFSGGYEGRIKIVGPDSTVQTVSYLVGMLAKEIERLSDEAWKAACAPGIHGKTWKNSFNMGAARTIVRRLKERQAVPVTGQALVLVQRDAIENANRLKAHVENKYGPLRNSKQSNTALNAGAFGAGQEAGRGINLDNNHRALGASKERLE